MEWKFDGNTVRGGTWHYTIHGRISKRKIHQKDKKISPLGEFG